ncbi:MAG: hypothetical protein WAN14_12720 [Candidatus Acidiferrales bacterium]
MSDRKYERVYLIERKQLRKDVESDDPQTVAKALYSAAQFDEDTKWVQDQCLTKLTSPEVLIRWAAATCLGDLAFSRRPLDVKKVILALERAKQDPAISDPASFSLSMVKQFVDQSGTT